MRRKETHALLTSISSFPPVKTSTSFLAFSISSMSVTSKLIVLMPIPSRSLRISLFRAVAMTWSPATPRHQPLLSSTTLSCQQAILWIIGVPFEWNSFASACPMPPGEHLPSRGQHFNEVSPYRSSKL
jgi:hypothetical protein